MENAIETYLSSNHSFKQYYLKNYISLIDGSVTEDDEDMLYYEVYQDTEIIMRGLSIPPNKDGFLYWIDAAYIWLLSEKQRVSICKDIYPAIAKKYSKTPMAVERAMRLCFENVNYNLNKAQEHNIVSDYFKNSLLNPHNSEILAKVVSLLTSKNFQQNKQNV